MKRKSTASTREVRENPKLLLSKAINALVAKQDGFEKAIEAIKTLQKDEIVKYDLEIEAKQEELSGLEEQYKHKLKNKQIETDQLLSEYKYEGATKILEEKGEMPINKSIHIKMQEELSSLKSDVNKQIQEAVAHEQHEAKRSMSAAISSCDLKHKAETAVLQATVDQQKKEISTLEKANTKLNEEIAAQRELTKQVAQAARAAPITQQIGK